MDNLFSQCESDARQHFFTFVGVAQEVHDEYYRRLINAIKSESHVNVRQVLMEYAEYNFDINERGRDGLNPLLHAVSLGYYTIVNYLLDNGSNVDSVILRVDDASNEIVDVESGRSALMIACYFRHVFIVEILLNRGATVNATDYAGNTALHYACNSDSTSNILITLLDHGADINTQNSQGYTPLMKCVERGYVRLVKLLLSYNEINVTVRYDVYNSAMSIALRTFTTNKNLRHEMLHIITSLLNVGVELINFDMELALQSSDVELFTILFRPSTNINMQYYRVAPVHHQHKMIKYEQAAIRYALLHDARNKDTTNMYITLHQIASKRSTTLDVDIPLDVPRWKGRVDKIIAMFYKSRTQIVNDKVLYVFIQGTIRQYIAVYNDILGKCNNGQDELTGITFDPLHAQNTLKILFDTGQGKDSLFTCYDRTALIDWVNDPEHTSEVNDQEYITLYSGEIIVYEDVRVLESNLELAGFVNDEVSSIVQKTVYSLYAISPELRRLITSKRKRK